MTDSLLTNEVSFFESLSKFFAATLGLVYLVGFLVVASYLSRYGVSSFAVLHLQYLVAGTWVLGPPVLHATLAWVERRFRERVAPEVERKFNWRRFAVSLLASGILSGTFVGLLATIPSVSDSITWKVGIRLGLFYLGMISAAQLFWMSRKVETATEKWWVNRSHAAPFYLACLLMTVLGYTLWFAIRIYPLIPFDSILSWRRETVDRGIFRGRKKNAGRNSKGESIIQEIGAL